MKITFYETQRFTQWWLWLFLIPLGLLPLIGIYSQLILKKPFGNNPMSDSGLILLTVFNFAIIALFVILRLKTEITERDIKMQFFPFVRKKVLWQDVKTAEVVQYGFVGYGIRFGSKYGIVYNIKGNKGLAVELKNGKKILIGTQKEAELKHLLKKMNL